MVQPLTPNLLALHCTADRVPEAQVERSEQGGLAREQVAQGGRRGQEDRVQKAKLQGRGAAQSRLPGQHQAQARWRRGAGEE